MRTRTEKLFFLLFLAVFFFLSGFILFRYYEIFEKLCPNKDVLSWDPNIRFVIVIDQMRDLHEGRFFRAIVPFFDAPTWPAFRYAISLVGFHLIGGIDPMVDVYVGMGFYFLALFSTVWVAMRLQSLWGAAAALFACAALLQTGEIPSYSMSGMLESQGMFFFLWTVFFLIKVYESSNEKNETISRATASGLFLSAQGLFHTKYPYGLILVIGLVCVELIRKNESFREFFFAVRSRYLGLRLLPVILLLIMISPVGRMLWKALRSVLETSGGTPPGERLYRNLVYFLLVFLFIDFNVYVYRFRFQLRRIFHPSTIVIYLCAIFPSIAWLLLHPDRLSSTLGTQLHEQDRTRSFFLSLIFDVFDQPWAPALAGFAIFAGIIIYLYYKIRYTTDVRNRPLFFVSLGLIAQFAVLELMTGNKQLRHIYHMLPAFLVLGGVWLFRIQERLPAKGKYLAFTFLALFLVCLSAIFALGDRGFLTRGYQTNRTFCFSGLERSIVDPARWVAGKLDRDKRYISINTFHDINATSPGRILASEIDLLGRLKTYPGGDYRNDSVYTRNSWAEFDSVLLISPMCGDLVSRNRLNQRFRETGSSGILENAFLYPAGGYCLEEFRLLKF